MQKQSQNIKQQEKPSADLWHLKSLQSPDKLWWMNANAQD